MRYTFLDKLCLNADQILRALTNASPRTHKKYPAADIAPDSPNEIDRKHSAGLMRVNHTGEICAQALYHAQALTSKTSQQANHLHHAMLEEGDHLHWCNTRLQELHSHTSYLNPLWYAGSFFMGITAGVMGDKWSLGFLAETEQQVVNHLENHLALLPAADKRSEKILAQMAQDEAMHRDEAIQAGANQLPPLVKKMMRLLSKVMVKTAYWV